MALKRVGVFNPITRQISETITVYSDKKIQFRDTGIYIHSSADGKLLFSADGTAADTFKFNGKITFSNDIVMSGNLTVNGDFVFGDAAVDNMTINGTVTQPIEIEATEVAYHQTLTMRPTAGGVYGLLQEITITATGGESIGIGVGLSNTSTQLLTTGIYVYGAAGTTITNGLYINTDGTITTGINIANATTGIDIATGVTYGLRMEGTYTNAIRIVSTTATTAHTSVRVLNTYTGETGYHTAVMGAAIYTPATTGYGAVIGVYGEANINGEFTGGTNWSFGVRGTLQLTNNTVINNGSSIFGAINASMKDDATPTLTAGHICGIYVENLIDVNLSAITGITAMIYMANNSSATCTMDTAIYLYGPKVTYFAQIYDGTVSGCIVADAVGGSQSHKIKIDIDGTDFYIPCHTA